MSSPEPLHSDRYRTPAFQVMNPVIAVFFIIWGIWTASGVAVLVGIAIGLLVWFTRHTRYDIFADQLVVHYGRPRQRIVPFADIEDVFLINLPMGGQGLLVRKKQGRGLLIRPRAAEQFFNELKGSLPQ